MEKEKLGLVHMDEIVLCNSLIAIYGEDSTVFGGPFLVEFETKEGIKVKINQCVERTIQISSQKETSHMTLYEELTRVEKLLMVFEGKFCYLKSLDFSGTHESDRLFESTSNLIGSRLAYYNSRDVLSSRDTFVKFHEVLTDVVYEKWTSILEDLDIAFQVYLYSLCANNMPVDVNCAFIIEMAEPMIELVKKNTNYYSSFTPESHDTSLKMCIDALITKYGVDIFHKELKADYNKFLGILRNSRVRVMHIKNKQTGSWLNGNESLLYMVKLSLLYRYILLDLMGLTDSKVKERVRTITNLWDNWNGISDEFLSRL